MDYTNRNEWKLDRRVHCLAFGNHNIVFGFEVGVECRTHKGDELWGKHHWPATAIVLAPAETYVICADANGILHSLTTGKDSTVLNNKTQGRALQTLLLMPGGTKLMGGDRSGRLLGWTAPFANEPVIEQFDDGMPIVAIVSGPHGKGYGCASKRKIAYNIGGPRLQTFNVHDDITAFGLCAEERPDGIQILAAQGNLIEVYDVRGNQARTFACDSPVTSLVVHPHGEFFATGEENGRVQLWHPVKGRTCELYNMGSRVDHVAFNTGRQLCAISSRGVVAIFGKE